MKIEEIKSYKCSDGKVFNTKKEAEQHEEELNNPDFIIKKLDERVLHLEGEIAILEARISCLENRKRFFPDPFQQPIVKFDKDYGKLPAEPGDIVFDGKNNSSNKYSN